MVVQPNEIITDYRIFAVATIIMIIFAILHGAPSLIFSIPAVITAFKVKLRLCVCSKINMSLTKYYNTISHSLGEHLRKRDYEMRRACLSPLLIFLQQHLSSELLLSRVSSLFPSSSVFRLKGVYTVYSECIVLNMYCIIHNFNHVHRPYLL